jgi:hypothetical protein
MCFQIDLKKSILGTCKKHQNNYTLYQKFNYSLKPNIMIRTIITCTLLSLSGLSYAQIPVNNTCITATTLTYNGACVNGTNTGANTTADGILTPPTCFTPSGGQADWNESVWYSITVPAGQTGLLITVTAGTLNAASMALYSGSCGTLTEISCSDNTLTLIAPSIGPGTYHLMLDGNAATDGTYCIAAQSPLANDNRCTATSITVNNPCILGTNIGATDGGDNDPSCQNGPANTENSVWYSFVATDDSITVNFGDGTLLTSLTSAVYSSSSGNCSGVLSEIGCTNNGSEIDLISLVIGQTYFIQVEGKADITGTFCIRVYETPPPPAPIGTCSNPRDLYLAGDCNNLVGSFYDEQNNLLSTNTTTGNDGGASMSSIQYLNFVEQSCGGTDVGQQGYWVRFKATSSSINVANYGGAGYDYSLYTGTPANSSCTAGLTAAGCLTVVAGDLTGNTLTTANGRTYYMLITPSGTGTASTAFACITAASSFLPTNDNCANAVALNFGTGYNLTTSNATVDIASTLCSGTTENNIWAYYQATYTGIAYVFLQDQDCACPNGTQMSIYNANTGCPSASSGCSVTLNPNNDNDFNGQFNVVNGSSYYIQLDGFAGCGCSFNLCINTVNSADCSMLLLPVEITDLNLYCENNKTTLKWSTESELNSSHFEIQKSADAIEFDNIGTVSAAGNSNHTINYEFTDYNNSSGYQYYRIKEVDTDNQFYLSKVMTINCGNDTETFSVFPNPGKGLFNFNSMTDGTLWIYNSIGETVLVKNCQEGQSELNLSHLEDGTYYFRLDGPNGSKMKKIMLRR